LHCIFCFLLSCFLRNRNSLLSSYYTSFITGKSEARLSTRSSVTLRCHAFPLFLQTLYGTASLRQATTPHLTHIITHIHPQLRRYVAES
jgi:hypothetical protein